MAIRSGPTAVARALVVLGVAAELAGQDVEAEFRAHFAAAVRHRDEAELAAAAALIDRLPEDKRRAARFGVDVRGAELRLHAGERDRARALAVRAHDAWRGDPVCRGLTRGVLLVVLWQCGDLASFAARLTDDDERYLAAVPADPALRTLEVPVRLLRAELQAFRGDELGAARAIRALLDELRSRGAPAADPWRQQCVAALFWHHFERRELGRALALLDELPLDTQRIYLRTLIALKTGDYPTAERGARKLVRRDAFWNGLLAEVLEARGELAAARACYAELERRATDPHNRGVALGGLGDCDLAECWRARSRGEAVDGVLLARGEECIRAALQCFAPLPTKAAAAEVADARRQLGRIAELRGDPAAALAHYLAALAAGEGARKQLGAGVFGSSWLIGVGRDDYLASVDGVLRTWSAGEHRAFGALAALEVGKARTLLDWTLAPPRAADAARLRAAVRRLALAAGPDEVAASAREFAAADDASASVGPGAAPLDAAALRAVVAAEPGTLFLSYWLGVEDAAVAWAHGRDSGVTELGPRAAVAGAIAAAHAAVADPGGAPWPALDRAAGAVLPGPLAGRAAAATRIVYCPDPAFARLPFEALRAGGEPLGVSVPVERAPSLSVRARLRARSAAGGGVLVVDSVEAAPFEAALGLPRLEFSGREGDLVAAARARASGAVARTRGADATLAALRGLLEGSAFDVVHVSAHAVQQSVLPTSTVLLLADGPASFVSLAEIELRGAELVLSACATGAGEDRGGEGELGLLGWPLAAGARAAVLASWHVNQQATSDLMAQYHAFRAAGRPRADAMRAARAVLAEHPPYAHPHYWAGFAVVGADDPLPPGSPFGARWLVVVAIAVGWVIARGLRAARISRRAGAAGAATRGPPASRP